MGAELDRLEVQIETSAKEANTQLDKLVSKLDKVQNALASISGVSSINGINAGTKGAITSFNTFTLSSNKLFRTSNNLTASFAKMYVGLNTLKRGFSALKESVKGSMDYIETLNYFNSAFGQVAEKADLSAWEKVGAASAEGYYNSFSSRAKELTSKMTGFNINDDGTLTATGNASLGIDPNKLMNYQAMFAQMSSSMGVASETSLKLSQALTEIGADLASVKNMDFDKVWTDMASGLAGMSRTLDKYGVNIRNVNLQQKLFDLGINANITNLNQNDKALLRAIILLDSTRYAWGNLASELETPANQMRLLDSNLNNLSRTIGNLFLPMVSKVLPYINGFVIAIQRLVTWAGSLMGIDLSEITKAAGSSEVDIGGLLDETDSLGDSLDDASKSAKKLKSNLQGFDELNVITTQDTSGLSDIGGGLSSGLLDAAFDDAFSEYQAAWDEAFANMENKAQEIADKIERFFQPVKDIIEDFAVGDFFKAGQDTSNLVSGIFNFFAKAIDDVDWYGIGQKIGDYLAGIEWLEILDSVGNLFWESIQAAIELWAGSFDTAPIETIIATALIGMKIAGVTLSSPVKIGLSIIVAAPNIAKAIGEALGIEETIFGDSIEDLSWSYFFDKLKEGFTDSEGNFSLTKGIEFTLDVLKADVKGTAELLGLSDSDNPIIKFLFSDTEELFKKTDIGGWIKTNISDPFIEKLQGLAFDITYIFDSAKVNIQRIWQTVSTWFSTNVIEPVAGFFDGFSTRVQQIFEGLWITAQAIWGVASSWFDEKVITPIVDFFEPIVDKVGGFFRDLWEDIEKIWSKVSSWFDTNVAQPIAGVFDSLWDGIGNAMVGAMNAIIGGIESGINFIIGGINDILGGFNKVVSWAAKIAEVDWGGVDLVPTISLARVPAFSVGGFPEDGLFFANHNELVGQFSNGRTAVANNEQITMGIADAVYPAVYDAVSAAITNSNRNNDNGDIVINMDGREVFRVTRQYAREHYNRTGNPAFS